MKRLECARFLPDKNFKSWKTPEYSYLKMRLFFGILVTKYIKIDLFNTTICFDLHYLGV